MGEMSERHLKYIPSCLSKIHFLSVCLPDCLIVFVFVYFWVFSIAVVAVFVVDSS